MRAGAKKNLTFELDDLDLDILRSLNDNARKSFRDIAKELHISLTTVSNRVKAMERAKVIHGNILETEKELAKDPAVYAVFDSTGDWDAVIMARFKNRAELNEFVKRALDHPNVDRTFTQIVLNITKDDKSVRV